MKAELPALRCRDDAVVENDAAAPKLCLPPLEMHSPTTAGGLLPTRPSLHSDEDHLQPATSSALLDPGDEFKEDKIEDSDLSVSYDSSLGRNKLLAAPSSRRVIETKS